MLIGAQQIDGAATIAKPARGKRPCCIVIGRQYQRLNGDPVDVETCGSFLADGQELEAPAQPIEEPIVSQRGVDGCTTGADVGRQGIGIMAVQGRAVMDARNAKAP